MASSSSNNSLVARFLRCLSNFHDSSGLQDLTPQPVVSTEHSMVNSYEALQEPDATTRYGETPGTSDIVRVDLIDNYHGVDMVSTRSDEIHTYVQNALETERRPRVNAYAVLKKCQKIVYKDRCHMWPGKVGKLDSEQSECPVCLEKILPKEKLFLLPCKHRFHIECLTPWIKSNHGCCPLCRADILGTSSKIDRRSGSYRSTLISAINFRPRRLYRRNSDIGPRRSHNDEWELLHEYVRTSLGEMDDQIIRLVR